MKKLIIALTLIAVLLLSLVACGKKPIADDQTAADPLKIGVLSGTTGMGAAKLIEDINAIGGSSEIGCQIVPTVGTGFISSDRPSR